MKTNLLKSFMLLMLMMVSMGAWADSKTFDLSTNSYSSSSSDEVTWGSSPVTVTLAKGTGTAANNYLGGSGSYTHTRVYNGNTFSVSVADGYYLTSVVITSTGSSYTMPTSGWTGGTASASDAVVTVTAAEETTTVSVNPGGTKRLTQVVVYYEEAAADEPCTVTLGDDSSELTEASVGAGVTLPSRSNIGLYTFRGWSETNVTTETATAPTIINAGAYLPTKDITLYPVYSRTEISAEKGEETIASTMAEYATANEWETSNSTTKYLTVNLNDVITIEADEKGTTGQWNPTNKYWGMYQTSANKSVWRVKSSAGDLVSVTFTYTSNNGGTISYDGNTYASGTEIALSGTTSGDFTVANTGSATNGQARITAISVKYETAAGGSKDYYISSPAAPSTTTINITTEEGYSTFVNSESFVMPEDLIGATAEVNNGELTWNWKYSEGMTVPANTPILVFGTEESYTADVTTGGTAPATNYLVANTTGATAAASALAPTATKFYVLSYNTSNKNLGFYWLTADGSSFDVPAGKVFLGVPESVQAKAAFVFGGDTDGVKNIENVKANNVVYNLNGQRVNANAKGIVIVNGKKYLNK